MYLNKQLKGNVMFQNNLQDFKDLGQIEFIVKPRGWDELVLGWK